MNLTSLCASPSAVVGVGERRAEAKGLQDGRDCGYSVTLSKKHGKGGRLSAPWETDRNRSSSVAVVPCKSRSVIACSDASLRSSLFGQVHCEFGGIQTASACIGSEDHVTAQEWTRIGEWMPIQGRSRLHVSLVEQSARKRPACSTSFSVQPSELRLSTAPCRAHHSALSLRNSSKILQHPMHTHMRRESQPKSRMPSTFFEGFNSSCVFSGPSMTAGAKLCSTVAGNEGGYATRKVRGVLCRSAIPCSSFDSKLVDEKDEPATEAKVQASDGETSDVNFLGGINSVAMTEGGGKTGFVSFHNRVGDLQELEGMETVVTTKSSLRSLLWLLGPIALVAAVVLPPLNLRKIFGTVLDDSLTTDFVILFFTETLFFIGASVFLFIAHGFRSQVTSGSAKEQKPVLNYPLGYRVSAYFTLAVGLFLPLATFAMVWPWTGPAAAAALAPYTVGILVQLSVERIVRVKKSPVWPLVPITFQMYRLHQLNRAAQLVSGLMFSLKGVEATAETLAISGSLQTLLFVLQVLGMVCVWSLGAFLTHQLPTQPSASSTASLP